MISVDNVTIQFGGFTLFDGISFQMSRKDRIGLVGRNGAGKTTLLNLVSGSTEPTSGKVVRSGDTVIGYLPQQMKLTGSRTLLEEAMTAFEQLNRLEKNIRNLNHQLSERTDHTSDDYLRLIEQLSTATERFELAGGNSAHARVEQVLRGLGFNSSEMDRPINEFSGGWRMRIELAKILLRQPDFILLDEPTNHLDINSIQWLEEYLKNYQGGVLLISHDRVFLDTVTNRTLDLTLGKIFDYRVSYSSYEALKSERIAHQMASYENQQKMIKDTEQFIKRFRYKASKAVQVQSRIKQLEKLDRIEVEQEDLSVMNLRFPPAGRSGNIVVEIRDLSKSFGNHRVLEQINLFIERGDKIAFVGRNGEGKTTLSRIIIGEIDHTGICKTGHNVSIGYFAQNQDELLDGEKTVLETVDSIAVGDIRTKLRDILGAFLFQGEDVDKKVKVLSGGEKSRLAMAMMLLQPFNFLVLDEPTNHLDMHSKDMLKNALKHFDGTLLVVSHDREFLDGLVDKVYEFRNRKIQEYLGGIQDFLQKRNIGTIAEIEQKIQPEKRVQHKKSAKSVVSYEALKEADRDIRKSEKKVNGLEKEIEQMEGELEEISQLLMDPEKVKDNEIFSEYETLRKTIDARLAAWEKASDRLENLKQRRESLI